jgi:hypothetical protein
MGWLATTVGIIGLGWVLVVVARNGPSIVMALISGGQPPALMLVGLAITSAALVGVGLWDIRRKLRRKRP